MMSKTLFFGLIFFGFSFVYWNQECQIPGSIWIDKYKGEESRRITFGMDDTCSIYYIQMKLTHTGRYQIDEDTLTIFEYELKSEIPGAGDEKVLRYINKYLKTDCNYYSIYYKDVKHGYVRNETDRDYMLTPFIE